MPLGPRYSGLRFQIDPIYPPPRRDVRYVMIVTGIALMIPGLLLLGVSGIVSDGTAAASSSCSPEPCSVPDPGVWFLWIALPFLAAGMGFLGGGLWWALGRKPAPA